MFCPNCGEKLDSPDQRFCASCGSELHFTPIPEVPKEIPQQIQVTTPVSTIPVAKTLPIKKSGPGSYSKKTFAFSFLSLALMVAGFSTEFMAFLRAVTSYYAFPRLPSAPVLLIMALVIHFVGIVFGVVSQANSSKAKKYEIENGLEKVGRVFGILGIIGNVIPLVVVNAAIVIMSVPISSVTPFP